MTQIKLTKSFWVTFILDLVHPLATFRQIFIFLLHDICNFQLEWDPKKIRQEMKDKDKEQQQQQQKHQVRQYLMSNFLAFNFKATSKITLNIF